MGYPAENRKKYTYQDYLLTPDDKRYELLEGELIMVPAPTTVHQRISRKLEVALDEFVKKQDLGEVFDAPCDVFLDDENVVQPDILFIAKERSDIITEANIKGAPDLIVEIISPASAYNDLVRKKKLYARFGVAEYWLVDPGEKTVEVLRLEDQDYPVGESFSSENVLISLSFPGLLIDLTEIFK